MRSLRRPPAPKPPRINSQIHPAANRAIQGGGGPVNPQNRLAGGTGGPNPAQQPGQQFWYQQAGRTWFHNPQGRVALVQPGRVPQHAQMRPINQAQHYEWLNATRAARRPPAPAPGAAGAGVVAPANGPIPAGSFPIEDSTYWNDASAARLQYEAGLAPLQGELRGLQANNLGMYHQQLGDLQRQTQSGIRGMYGQLADRGAYWSGARSVGSADIARQFQQGSNDLNQRIGPARAEALQQQIKQQELSYQQQLYELLAGATARRYQEMTQPLDWGA